MGNKWVRKRMDGELGQNPVAAGQAEDKTRFLKALANPWRLRLLHVLLHGPMTVGELEARLGLSQAYVSQQLARLRADGLVTGTRNGRQVRYSVVDARVRPVLGCLDRQ